MPEESIIIETKFEQDVRKELAEIKQQTEELIVEYGSPPMIG